MVAVLQRKEEYNKKSEAGSQNSESFCPMQNLEFKRHVGPLTSDLIHQTYWKPSVFILTKGA